MMLNLIKIMDMNGYEWSVVLDTLIPVIESNLAMWGRMYSV